MTVAPSMLAITIAACLAEVLGMAGFAAFPTLMPTFFAEWGLTNTEAGWINGIFYVGYLVAVAVLTSLTDRLPARDVYLASTAVSGLACLGFAVFAEGFWTALAFRTLAGVGLAGTYMPGLKMLSDFLGGPRQSRSVAFYTSSFGIGASASILATGWLEPAVGWRWAFGLLALGPAAAIAITLLRVPRRHADRDELPDTHLLDFRPVLRCRAAMAYVLAYTVHNFELFAYRAWTVAYLVFAATRHPETGLPASAAVIASVINLCGVPASILGNELAVRIGRHRLITGVMLFSGVLACAVGFAANLSPWLLIVLLALYSMTVGGESASVTAGVVEAAPKGYRGATMAVHSSIAFGGAFLGPLMFGVALDATGAGATVASWGAAFTLLGVVVATGPVFLWWLGGRDNIRLNS